ncbi:MAG: hypothetical protein IJ623_01710 [Bacteroidales bacterium]|nr:hypothetical protein [Bacteroidales bacterium]
MKRHFLHILTLLAVLLPLSCTKEAEPEVRKDKPAVDYEGREVTVYFGVQTPEPATKAMGENPEITSLHVAVFGSSGYLKEYKRAEPVGGYVSAEGEANKKGYKVNLSITSSRVRVHLIANGPESLDFDYESNVMAKLASSGGQDAYWQRILLNNGIYADTEAEGYYDTPPTLVIDPDFDLEDGVHKMALIPLIRNFAKITVVAAADSNFEVQSFAVINVPDRGSIAPYNPTNGEFIMNYEAYPTLTDISAVYPGNMPSATVIDKSYPSESDFSSLSNGAVGASSAVYMYERPVPTKDATILVVKGTYTDPDTHEANTGYYKIDLMEGGEYLPILRNFRYQINIQKVHRKGKTTVAGAINGAGSADISADIATASQVNISDGKSAISVSYTEKTWAIKGTYTLGVTFTSDVTTGTVDNSLVTFELREPDANGAVIASESDISYNASTGTLSYTTTDVDPTRIKSQVIRVIGTSGTSRLYRDITIRLLPQQQMTVTCIPEIEQAEGTPQTVTVSIPKDLPQSIFPLQFRVEVAEKSLTPNASDLPVEPGKTIVDGRTGNSYQFIKTVSYQQYTAGYSGDHSVFTCEFKSIIPESDSEIYVSNQFFSTGSTSFTTFEKRFFSSTSFSTSAATNEDDPVNFFFTMDAEHEEISEKLIPEVVDVYLTGLVPDYEHYPTELQQVSGNHYVYTVPTPGYTSQVLHLLSTGDTENPYSVQLKAQYYEDHELVNVQNEFTGLTFGTVFYGRGWPTTFRFTIPNDFEMPAVGYIDIELGLTNLVPDDANIITAEGKYYYRAYSTGTKTLSLKTADSQTAAVGVQLKHRFFATAVGTQSSRQYLNIAAGRITNIGPNNAFRNSRNTVYIYTNKNTTGQVSSYQTNLTGNNATSATNYSAANFASNVVDASTKLYLSMYSNYNRVTYRATTTAEALYNNGNATTVNFTTGPFGSKEVTINTTNANYSTTNRSYTYDDVTVAFSNLSGVSGDYVTMADGSTVTISVAAGYHITNISISYDGENYAASGSVTSGGGTFSGTTTGTWTSANNSTTSVTLRLNKRDNGWFTTRYLRPSSIVVTIVED